MSVLNVSGPFGWVGVSFHVPKSKLDYCSEPKALNPKRVNQSPGSLINAIPQKAMGGLGLIGFGGGGGRGRSCPSAIETPSPQKKHILSSLVGCATVGTLDFVLVQILRINPNPPGTYYKGY